MRGAGCGACARKEGRPPSLSGGLGSSSGLTMGLCRSRLDEDRMKAGKSRRIRTRRVLLSRKYDPEDRNRCGGASKGVSRPGLSWRHEAGRAQTTKARLSALLLPLSRREAAHGLKTSLNGHPRFSRGKAMTRVVRTTVLQQRRRE
jgi:hypothetical protein